MNKKKKTVSDFFFLFDSYGAGRGGGGGGGEGNKIQNLKFYNYFKFLRTSKRKKKKFYLKDWEKFEDWQTNEKKKKKKILPPPS